MSESIEISGQLILIKQSIKSAR